MTQTSTRPPRRWPLAALATVLAATGFTAFLAISVSAPTTGAEPVMAPSDADVVRDHTHPVVYATGDCASLGSDQEQVRYRLHNPDFAAHTIELFYDGAPDPVRSHVLAARSSVEGVFDVDGAESDDDRPLRAVVVDTGRESLPVFVRAKRCVTRYPDQMSTRTSVRANGPTGWVGLECVDGRLHISWSLINTDVSAPRHLSVDIYSARTDEQDPRRVASTLDESRIDPGERWAGSVPFPYDDVYTESYDGALLIRGFHRFEPGEFERTGGRLGSDPGLLHSRTFFESMPYCASPSRPSAPTDLAHEFLDEGSLRLTWNAAVDDNGVASYVVYRNNERLFTVGSSPAVIPAPLPGTWFWQVRAVDVDGNQSVKTPPLEVTVEAPG